MDPKLRKKIGDDLASTFDEVAEGHSDGLKARIADTVATEMAAVADDLAKKLRDDHGRHGIERAAKFIAPWAEDLAREVLAESVDTVEEKVLAALRTHFETDTAQQPAKAADTGEPMLIRVKRVVKDEQHAAKVIASCGDTEAYAEKQGDGRFVVRYAKTFETPEAAKAFEASKKESAAKLEQLATNLRKIGKALAARGKPQLSAKALAIADRIAAA